MVCGIYKAAAVVVMTAAAAFFGVKRGRQMRKYYPETGEGSEEAATTLQKLDIGKVSGRFKDSIMTMEFCLRATGYIRGIGLQNGRFCKNSTYLCSKKRLNFYPPGRLVKK